MKILLLGKNGQVGRELQKSLPTHTELLALGREVINGYCGDLEKPESLLQTIDDFQPNVIFNAAAYTAVDKAEAERERALQINSTSVKLMAEKCKAIGCLFVHFSTDYVFDGCGNKPYLEDDLVNPINYYGYTKLLGEQALEAIGCDYLIFRTSWVFSIHGQNFLKTILRLIQTQSSISVVHDQIGVPTSATFLADIATSLALRKLNGDEIPNGIYNLVPSGEVSWYDFACWIADNHCLAPELVKLRRKDIIPVTSDKYPSLTKRPLNSRLCTNKIRTYLAPGEIKTWDCYAYQTLVKLQNWR